MKIFFKPLIGAAIILLIAMQFIPHGHNEAGNAVDRDIAGVYQLPSNIGVILKRSCYDCHSDQTNYPWYAALQPFRLLIDNHVRDGKAELNFNSFGNYTARKQRSKLRAISESLEEGSMPLSSYTLLHHSASLSNTERTELINWFTKTQKPVEK